MSAALETGNAATVERLAGDVVILMYHHCAPLPADAVVRGLYVTPAQFAWQMDWLRGRQVRFCTLADLASRRAPATGAPRVVVTFDDGLRDVYENAWPVLAARRIPAVVFPVVGDIGKTGVVWSENKDKSPKSVMSEAQIREMSAGGIEFGSHLWEHRKATRLSTVELRDQLVRSAARLAEITGREIQSIAYPYGDCSDDVIAATAAAGYRVAVTTEEGSNRNLPILKLRRHAVKGTRMHHRLRFIRALRRSLAAAQDPA